MRQTERVSEPAATRTLSAGSLAVVVGLGVFGASSFALLGLAGRDLGPAGSAPVAVAWTAVNAVGLGLFVPVEQEVARLASARRPAGQPAPRLVHVLRYLALASALVAVVAWLARGPLADTFFSGDRAMVGFTAAALVAVGLEYLVRGTLAGFGLFVRYGVQLTVDGLARVGLAALVYAAGWGSREAYAWALVLAPLLAAAATVSLAALRWLRDRPTDAGRASLAPLVATTVASQLLGNAGPLAIAVLAGRTDPATTGSFVSVITVGRIPLFLYAAVQAVLLPTLSGLVARGARAELLRTLRTTLLATTAVGVLGVAGIAVLGRWALHVVYGPAFTVAWLDLVLVAVSGAAYMLALATGHTLLAFRRDPLVLLGWVLGLLATVACLALPLPVTTRVATALVVGSAASAASHGAVLTRVLRQWAPGGGDERADG